MKVVERDKNQHCFRKDELKDTFVGVSAKTEIIFLWPSPFSGLVHMCGTHFSSRKSYRDVMLKFISYGRRSKLILHERCKDEVRSQMHVRE